MSNTVAGYKLIVDQKEVSGTAPSTGVVEGEVMSEAIDPLGMSNTVGGDKLIVNCQVVSRTAPPPAVVDNKITDVEAQTSLVTYVSISNKVIKVTIINKNDSVLITKRKYGRKRNIKKARFGRIIHTKRGKVQYQHHP